MPTEAAVLRLLQLASATLPVGAYAYSEGLEALIAQGMVADRNGLADWLERSLEAGSVRLEAAIMRRVLLAAEAGDDARLAHWNHWLSATKETEELRLQSAQMGRSLAELLRAIAPAAAPLLAGCGEPINYAVAFGVAAATWRVPPRNAMLGFLQSWATNTVQNGVKSIPLGQTAGQGLLLALDPVMARVAREIESWPDEDLGACGWGLTLASMAHETQYSRLYRS